MAKASPFNAFLNPLSSQHASFSVDRGRKSFADSPFVRRALCPGGAATIHSNIGRTQI